MDEKNKKEHKLIESKDDKGEPIYFCSCGWRPKDMHNKISVIRHISGTGKLGKKHKNKKQNQENDKSKKQNEEMKKQKVETKTTETNQKIVVSQGTGKQLISNLISKVENPPQKIKFDEEPKTKEPEPKKEEEKEQKKSGSWIAILIILAVAIVAAIFFFKFRGEGDGGSKVKEPEPEPTLSPQGGNIEKRDYTDHSRDWANW